VEPLRFVSNRVFGHSFQPSCNLSCKPVGLPYSGLSSHENLSGAPDRFSYSFPDNLFLTKAFNRAKPAFLITGTADRKISITFTDLVPPKRVNFVSSVPPLNYRSSLYYS